MKTISLEKAPAAVAELFEDAKQNLVVVTRSGVPVAYVLPADIYDAEDIGYMTDPEFWKMIRERRESNDGIPLEQIKAELDAEEESHK